MANDEALLERIASRSQKRPERAGTVSEQALRETNHQLLLERMQEIRARRKHRKQFDSKTFTLLRIQVVFLAGIILLQGFKPYGFHLDEWVFGIFVNGSLIYTYAIICYIASDLFNGKHDLLKQSATE